MRLMELIVSRDNMMRAYRQVVANKGAPGIDKMTVERLGGHLKASWAHIREDLLEHFVNRLNRFWIPVWAEV